MIRVMTRIIIERIRLIVACHLDNPEKKSMIVFGSRLMNMLHCIGFIKTNRISRITAAIKISCYR
jgi:hypothetical protein